MKKILFISVILLVNTFILRGQTPFISCLGDFENQPGFSCWAGVFSLINDSSANNIWQVCVPNKPVFNLAHSPTHAILTDSTSPYPVNNASSFIIKVKSDNDGFDVPVIGGWYKFDSDSLNDYGRIEISLDHGLAWTDILSDSTIYWVTSKPVFTGRIYQWREFFGLLPFIYQVDTVYFRYTFLSDSIQTNQQGWMLDDLYLLDHIEGIEDQLLGHNVTVFPNPGGDQIFISVTNFNSPVEVSLFDLLGQLHIKQSLRSNSDRIDISSLSNGIYIMKVDDTSKQSIVRILKK